MKNLSKILVVLNPFDDTNIEVDHALKIASQNKASIELVAFRHHSEHEILQRLNLEHDVKGRLATETLEKINKKISPLKEQGVDISARVEWCEHVALAIIEMIKTENYDLLIKAPNPTSVLKNIVTTPTDWNILRSCPCPVWFAKPDTQLGHNVIAAIDISDDSPAAGEIASQVIHQANYLSHLFGSQLHVVNAFPVMPAAAHLQFVSIYENEYLKTVQNEHEQGLEKLLEPFDVPDNYRHVIAGEADQVLVDFMKHNPASILVIGTAAREGMAGLLTGNTAERILSRVECDILVVKTEKQPA